MENKVVDNREEKRIGVFNSLNSGIDFKGAFHTYEQETILKAMQEYADLRCKPLVKALENTLAVISFYDCPDDIDHASLRKVVTKALQDYNKK